MDEQTIRRVSKDRLETRQVDELIGLARGLIADETINQKEIEFLQKWLAANSGVAAQPLMNVLYRRVNEILADGIADDTEKTELLDTLKKFTSGDFELGETLKSTTLPLCNPAPTLSFENKRYCFTSTFNFGQRKYCEAEILMRGGEAGSLTQKTDFLIIGEYATDSWRHSSFGAKIVQAAEWRDSGIPIRIVSEQHWKTFL